MVRLHSRPHQKEGGNDSQNNEHTFCLFECLHKACLVQQARSEIAAKASNCSWSSARRPARRRRSFPIDVWCGFLTATGRVPVPAICAEAWWSEAQIGWRSRQVIFGAGETRATKPAAIRAAARRRLAVKTGPGWALQNRPKYSLAFFHVPAVSMNLRYSHLWIYPTNKSE